MEQTILAIDDDPALLEVLRLSLWPNYQLRIATHGGRGLELASLAPLPDLILLDVSLPDMHGYDICAALKQNQATAEIPVIFLSSHSDVDNVTRGLELGAVDFVSKPVIPPILLARMRTHLRLREATHLLRHQKAHLETLIDMRTRALQTRSEELHARTQELQLSHDLTIIALGSIAETRDNETGNHIQRTRAYIDVMTRDLARLEPYRHTVHPESWQLIVKSAPLHDLGKVGIPDHILLKPGKLTQDEFEVMKRHPAIGREALRLAEARLGSSQAFLGSAMEIAYCHHERWDGTGYPEGIGGSAIPLSARLMAVADVYDALISRRVYKPPMPHAQAVELIREGRGRHFDPALVDCFLANADQFARIADQFSDSPTEASQDE